MQSFAVDSGTLLKNRVFEVAGAKTPDFPAFLR
jgi:hypothetical protein